MTTYRERREARTDRLRDWAASREAKAGAAFDKAREVGDAIPMGQPILVGHHSERRHRRDVERIESSMSKGVEHSRKAESMASRADGIDRQLATSIYSDDPDAIEALEAKIAKREARRDEKKKANAQIRKALKGVDQKDWAETLTRAGLAAAISPMYREGCGMWAVTYDLKNDGANIRRLKERIEEVKTRQARAAAAEEASDGVVIEGEKYVAVTFAEKPERSVIEALKAAGFRWSRGSWYGSRDAIPEEVAS